MRLAIMQPYTFPYIGYFQLIHAVDAFVFYDDVHFIKKGFIHRNSILHDGAAQRFTIPCQGASQNALINSIFIAADSKALPKFLNQLQHVYKQAPYFDQVMPLIQSVLDRNLEGVLISELAMHSVRAVCAYLDMQTPFLISSESFSESRGLDAESRLIHICQATGADTYINAIGGQALYTSEAFHAAGIALHFLKSKPLVYSQFQTEFVPWLSIIDVLMFNSPEHIQKEFLTAYTLL